MLNLASETAPGWVENALRERDAILLDHAHCEKKAAGAAVNLLFRYPQHAFLQAPLAELAREELEHFERLLRTLEERKIPFARQRPSAYGGRLHRLVREREPERLLDTLLVCGLIEARSCERLKLLAEAWPDPGLASLYRDLLASEARHHGLYVELAQQLAPVDEVRARLAALAVREAEILTEPAPAVRLHSGTA